MRAPMLALSILPLFAIGQGDCKYSRNEIDEFTGAVKRETKAEVIGHWSRKNYRFFASVAQVNEFLYGRINIPSNMTGISVCLSSESYVMVKFTDGEVVRADYIGKIDCDGPTMAWGIMPDMVTSFSSKAVQGIRIGTSDGYMDLEVNDPELFIRHMRCVEILSE